MNYRNDGLIDISLNVDMSALKERLDEIETRLDESSGVTEDKVTTLIEDYVGSNDLQTADDVASYIDGEGYVKGDDIDERIRDYVHSEGLMDNSEVDDAIDAKLEDYVTASEVRDILTEEGLDPNSVPDAEEVDTLRAKVDDLSTMVGDLERRFEMYATRVDDLIQDMRRWQDNQARGDESITRLSLRLHDVEERNQTALDFFGLIQQAFNLLKRGA